MGIGALHKFRSKKINTKYDEDAPLFTWWAHIGFSALKDIRIGVMIYGLQVNKAMNGTIQKYGNSIKYNRRRFGIM